MRSPLFSPSNLVKGSKLCYTVKGYSLMAILYYFYDRETKKG